jgi:hypothetical protein
MPTYDVSASFWRDWRSLTPQQRLAFRRALGQFIADLRSGAFRPGLRVKRVQRHPGIWEMTWTSRRARHVQIRRGDPWRAAHQLAADRDPRRLPAPVISALPRILMYPFGTRGRVQGVPRPPQAKGTPVSIEDPGDGASRTRTGDLLGAIQALSQLSYSPVRRPRPRGLPA